jgi:HK97 family phage major capsid protein
MGAGDALLARYQAEIEERGKFIDGVVEGAEKEERDLSEQELTLLARTRDRITALNEQVAPLQSTIEIAATSRKRTAEIALQFAQARDPQAVSPMEYRSAGEYVCDVWRAGLGHTEAAERLDLFMRAAAHQTTADNPGLLPEQILGPIVNYVDTQRPLINVLGARNLPSGSWSRPRVTQHTQVGKQSAEKAELPSRKMTIGKLPVTASTFGGYVNVSRQDADWTQPGVMDIIINDLAGQYAIETENAAADDLAAAATAGPVIPTGAPTAAAIAGALWVAAAAVFTATKGLGSIIGVTGPDMLGLLGPLFPPVNPQNAQSSGLSAGNFGSGPIGSISGIPFYVTAGMATNTMLVLSTAAAEVYEDRIGPLQVVEPSVLGIQVAYAGYMADLVVEPGGIVKVTKTP